MAATIQYSWKSESPLRGMSPIFHRIKRAPELFFQTCLSSQRLKTAASYLLVLHNLEQLDENNEDVIRLLDSAMRAKDWRLCRELLRFLHSIDETGSALKTALTRTNIVGIPEFQNATIAEEQP
jgi:hypothetical protein